MWLFTRYLFASITSERFTSLRETLMKVGTEVVVQGRIIVFQVADLTVLRTWSAKSRD